MLRSIYKPNQYLFLVMSPSKNAWSVPTTTTETTTLDLSSSALSYVTQTDLATTITFIFAKLDELVKNLTATIIDNDARFDKKNQKQLQPLTLQVKENSETLDNKKMISSMK